jgi:hypothetical protein
LKWKDYVYILDNVKINKSFEYIVEEYYDDIFMDLNDMKVKMFEILDKTKITDLDMFPENLGVNNELIFSFKYEGRECEVKELIGDGQDELCLFMSAIN